MNHSSSRCINNACARKQDLQVCAFSFTFKHVCVYHAACLSVFNDCRERHAHPLNVKLHILLGTALDLLVHFSHQRLHVYDAFLGDAGGDSWESEV